MVMQQVSRPQLKKYEINGFLKLLIIKADNKH